MVSPRHPLRLNVGFLVNQPLGYSRDFHFDFPQIHLLPDLDLTHLAGIARIGRTPQGLLVQCKFSASLNTECVRCLNAASIDLKPDFTELYAFSQRSVSESGLILPEDGNIDLEPVLREYLVIEIPISPLCKPECKGLCLVCGEDLNVATCEHQVESNERNL